MSQVQFEEPRLQVPERGGTQSAARAPATTWWMASALDEVDYPMFGIAAEGRLEWANRAARAVLRCGEPLAEDAQGRLRASDAGHDLPFKQACLQAHQRGLRRWLELPGGRAAAVLPLATALPGGPTALVVLSRATVCEQLTLEGYARLHGLTPAETEVLAMLAAGHKPSDIARRHSVAISTVRTQIGSLRAKTGSRSIPALVASLSLLPPMMSVVGRA